MLSSCCFQIRICELPKKRPAIVVQVPNLATGLTQQIVAMVTSNMQRGGHPSRVALQQSSSEARQMGLLTDSVVMTDNLATVREKEIDRIIGTVPDMTSIDNAL